MGRLRDRHGITLVELMVVVAIIAVIAAIAVTMYQDIQRKARLAADLGTVAALRSAAAIYFGRNEGGFPTKATLGVLVQPAPPVFQCTGADFNIDTSTGLVTYTPNDVAQC
jgi:type IV pilus assembly protein PilA